MASVQIVGKPLNKPAVWYSHREHQGQTYELAMEGAKNVYVWVEDTGKRVMKPVDKNHARWC